MFILWLLVMSSLQNAFFYSPQVDPSLILVTELTTTCEQCLYLKFSHTSLRRGRKGGERGGREEGVGEKKTERSRREEGMEGGRQGKKQGVREGGMTERWMEEGRSLQID